jgi:hypothetical protein
MAALSGQPRGTRRVRSKMPRVVLMVVTSVLLLLVAGVTMLAVWDVPTPNHPIDRVIPDSRFPK